MKKKLLLTLIFTSFILGISSVKADELPESVISNFYNQFDNYVSNSEQLNSDISRLLSYYTSNLSSTYPYYYIYRNESVSNYYGYYHLIAISDTSLNSIIGSYTTYNSRKRFVVDWDTSSLNGSFTWAEYYIRQSDDTITMNTEQTPTYNNGEWVSGSGTLPTCVFGGISSHIVLISSNYNLYYKANSLYSSIRIPYWSSSNYDITYQSFELLDDDIFPSYSALYNGDYIPSVNYTTINLNDYDYVALSLKDYTTPAIDTNFMVQGQLCLTPVYNYGMTEKVSTSAGYQVDRCSPIYTTSSPVRVSILEQDITNHAIYYLKAYDTSFDNIIRVDSSIFNISYISSSDAENPSVLVEGRYYPTIPYSQLTSSATISEAEGYVSGQVNNLFDVSSDSNVISSIFSNPITALQSCWASITIMFGIIGQFITLLPLTLQAFLFTSFSLALILGLIKIVI